LKFSTSLSGLSCPQNELEFFRAVEVSVYAEDRNFYDMGQGPQKT
jgi:hypothetical protein